MRSEARAVSTARHRSIIIVLCEVEIILAAHTRQRDKSHHHHQELPVMSDGALHAHHPFCTFFAHCLKTAAPRSPPLPNCPISLRRRAAPVEALIQASRRLTREKDRFT
ncbi:predicted protein [Plenodomus lingam JN3]|uniref:Predicted protein n=1 Tax=Leptosphaeria maculans (strain JN3 / isolate v23.1.3 / race Av1-4-5-6-7-8) TaxID=985895 RepID=E5R5C1_LEPMJ|nr:predicted protein [Plenodomus lingam JN3]CBX92091.1 predicted protein [Plenodomus lingam JN3]